MGVNEVELFGAEELLHSSLQCMSLMNWWKLVAQSSEITAFYFAIQDVIQF